MEREQFIKKRAALLKKKKAQEDKINQEYSLYASSFLAACSQVEVGKVYELKETGSRSRKVKRVVIYSRDVQFFDNCPFINAGGWILDEKSIPVRWKSWVVYGASNPTVFELSVDQTHHPVPKDKK